MFRPEKILIEKDAAENAQPFLVALPTAAVEYAESARGAGPRTLLLKNLKGAALKPFRTGGSDCAGGVEFAVRHALGCPYDCTYCYLQTYDDTSVPTVFINRKEILEEIDNFIGSHDEPAMLLAGHLSETLPLMAYDNFLAELCGLVRRFPKHALEVRTKGTDVGVYEGIEPAENIIPSWTLSPEAHRKKYERGTPSIEKRLEAMAKLQAGGWSVGVRLDPVVRDDAWEDAYRELIEKIFSVLDAEKIRDIHIGALRYVSELGDIIRARDPESPLALGEQFLSPDGKVKYARPLRIEMYRRLISRINARAKVVVVMEPPEVIEEVFK
ncbi:MAG: hypothetical protein E3J72_06205 [Planctomycetota bacterium]|nr:MAG: hypothetical protein E3J72_06205 [Planctomycetota bacterium]